MAAAHDMVGGDSGVVKPLRVAACLATIYCVFCVLYIAVSSHMAARHAASLAELERIETVKGLLFVVACSLLLFGLTFWFLLRIANGQRAIARHTAALVAAERRATAGLFATSVAHDMNNILTVGVATADLLSKQKGLTPAQADMVGDIASTFSRMTDLTRHLSAMGRGGLKSEFVETDLVDIARKELDFARSHARLRACHTTLQAQAPLMARISPPMLQQMLVNLLLNAADAAGPGGRVELRVGSGDDGPWIEVHDSGPGVPEDQREKIFDAFYTTKEGGLGLGLISVSAAAQVHRGGITVNNSPLGGACFRVTLPVQSTAS